MIIDIDSGEIIKSKFTKLYFNDISKLFGLNETDIKILLLMVKSIGLGNTSMIDMHPKRKKEYAKQINKTTRSVDNALKNLKLSGIIKKLEPESRVYMVNPDIIFSGNDYQRAKVIIDYSSGSRKVKAFANEDEAVKYLQSVK